MRQILFQCEKMKTVERGCVFEYICFENTPMHMQNIIIAQVI